MSAAARGRTVVILGGGVGGVAAANRLRRRLDRRHRVVLVNREPDFAFAASFLWVMSGQRRAERVTRPLSALQRRGIDVVIGPVEQIDPVTRRVQVAGRWLTADDLVIALGADYATDAIPGLSSAGSTFATLPGAGQLRVDLGRITTGRVLVVTAAPVYRCPAAPYEAALLIDAGLRRRGVRSAVEVAIRAAEPGPMGVAGPNVSAAVKELLAARDIDYLPGTQIQAAEPGIAHFTTGTEHVDVLAYMPGIRPPAVLADSRLASASGWVHVDRRTLATDFPGVHAIGDNTEIPLAMGKPLPRAGVFAHGQALAVADRIAAQVVGRAPTAQFNGHGGCFIETGSGRAGYGAGDFTPNPPPRSGCVHRAGATTWARSCSRPTS